MIEEEFDELEIILRPLVNQLANICARSVIGRADDSGDLQQLQISVLESETIDDAEHFQQYGFSSVPLVGAEAVVIFPGGDHAHPLVVAVDDRRHRKGGLNAGEVAIYNNAGASILLTEDGDIVVEPAAGRKLFVRRAGGGTDQLVLKGEFQRHTHLTAGTGAPTPPTPLAGSGGALTYTEALESE